MRRSARPQQPLAVRDGAQVRVNGRPVTAKEVSNEALGSGDRVVISGAGGEVQQELGRVSRSASDRNATVQKGNVKIFVQWSEGAIVKVFLGGDQPAKQIFEFDSSTEFAAGIFGEAIGSNPDDWIFTARLYNRASKQYKLHTIFGDGRRFTVSNQKVKFMNYKGNGFWATGVVGIEGKYDYDAPLQSSGQAAGQLQFTRWQGGTGGIFSEVTWNIAIPFLEGAPTGFTLRTNNGPARLAGANPEIVSLFPPDLSGNFSAIRREEKRWLTIPGAQQDISAYGGNLCSSDGPSTSVAQGSYSNTTYGNLQELTTYKLYTAHTYQGQVFDTEGLSTRSNDEQVRSLEIVNNGPDFTVSVSCLNFGGFIGSRYVLSSTPALGGTRRYEGNESYRAEDSYYVPIPIAPNVERRENSSIVVSGTSFSNRVTDSNFELYNSIRVFGRGAYFRKSARNTEYKLLIDGAETTVDYINGDPLKTAYIVVDGELRLTNIDDSIDNSIYSKKITKTNVKYSKNFVDQEDIEAKIQQIKIPDDSSSANKTIISAWHWPA